MSVIDLRRRLDCIGSACHTGAPTCVMADAPIDDDEADAARGNWRVRVSQGRATARNGVLYLTERPDMSESDWIARHVTAYLRSTSAPRIRLANYEQ